MGSKGINRYYLFVYKNDFQAKHLARLSQIRLRIILKGIDQVGWGGK